MRAVTDAYPELIGARLDMASLTGQLESCASPHAGAAADLNDLVRQITHGHLPETFTDSARAVTGASDAATRAFFLSLGIRNEHAGSGMPGLLTSVREVLQEYARETMTADAALFEHGVHPRAE
jgi:hypothetical protein